MIYLLFFYYQIVVDMKTTFLGTAAGRPTLKRNVTSIAIEMDNSKIILVDSGEATLHQFMKSKLKISNIHTILITHLHGDHIYGLPGLCCTMSDVRTDPLHIYGPRGLNKYCDMFRRSVYFDIVVHEIFIDFINVTTIKTSTFRYIIEACHVRHTTECYAYSITKSRIKPKIIIEKLQPIINANKEAITEMGISPPNKIIDSLIKNKEVFIEKTNVIIKLEDFIRHDSSFKIIIAMDNSNCDNMIKYFHKCNVLIHESTFNILNGMTREEIDTLTKMAITRGHSTNVMAAKNANKIISSHLILTHFSNRYEINDAGIMVDEDKIIEACYEYDTHYQGKVHLAYDFSEFSLN